MIASTQNVNPDNAIPDKHFNVVVGYDDIPDIYKMMPIPTGTFYCVLLNTKKFLTNTSK